MSAQLKSSNGTAQILMVEDNVDHARLMEIMIRKSAPQFKVIVAETEEECFKLLDEISIDLVVLDYELPKTSGLEILKKMKQPQIKTPVIIVTGKGDELIAVQAMKNGAYDYLVKDKTYMYVLPRVIQQTLEKHSLEKRLAESERKHRSLVDSITDFISVQDQDFNITMANLRAAEISQTPIKKLIGQKCYKKYFNRESVCDECPVLKTFETKEPHLLEVTYENEIYHIRSHPIYDLNDEVQSVIEIGQIVTDQRRMQKQLIQSEKLAMIGLLSSGIAHEIRNPLNIIEAARYFIAEAFGKDNPDLQNKLEMIQKSVFRASTIISNLLEFSRQSKERQEAIDINELIEKTVSLIGKELVSKNINLQREFQQLPRVFLNLDSIKQVLLNLIINAIQAMPKGGDLTLRSNLLPDNRVKVDIQDTGIGIPRKNIPLIFSPFFTTKDVGVGTGLGLYISHTLLQREGGEISVESVENKGSTFTIKLPTVITSKKEG